MMFLTEVVLNHTLHRSFLVEADQPRDVFTKLDELNKSETEAGEPLFVAGTEILIEPIQFENDERIYDLGLQPSLDLKQTIFRTAKLAGRAQGKSEDEIQKFIQALAACYETEINVHAMLAGINYWLAK